MDMVEVVGWVTEEQKLRYEETVDTDREIRFITTM